MPGYSFCFYYGKDNKDKKSLDIDEENASVEEPLKEFAKDFQKKPEDYKDLLVRIAGYSAYFVELSTELQNDLIGRTELSFD